MKTLIVLFLSLVGVCGAQVGIHTGAADKAPGRSNEKRDGPVSGAFAGVASCIKVGDKCVRDAVVCSSGAIDVYTNGVDKKKKPKGCAAPFASDDCLDAGNHRAFTTAEWSGPAQLHTSLNGPDFPEGKYGLYLSYGRSVARVGTMTLKACVVCAWMVRGSNGDAGIGGPPAAACTQAFKGRYLTGNLATTTWSCECK
jgi:hypothetical protein